MKKIGDITPTADENSEFTDGDVSKYTPPTLLMAAWFNAIQRELCNVVGFDGTPLDGANDQQVLEAIRRLVSNDVKKIQLGNSAAMNVGTTTGTVAAGDDTRITGALQAKRCLEELKNGGPAAMLLSLNNIGGFPSSGGTISGDTTVEGVLKATGKVCAGGAEFATNGDIFGGVWGSGWLSSWLNDRFSNRNTATLTTNGWFRDASTGFMIQWGTYPGGTGTYTVNLPQPFPHAALWALGWVNGALNYGDDDWSNSAGLVSNSQIRVTVDHGWSTSWIVIGW
ncbi:hypothetical protein G9I05_004357 [Salmonella enterica]|nr:hypothetical protein [Salmonella enterica]EEN5590614.1 hypothetical protein [Salmonella enterica subsp. enterica serovar Mountpleasant]EIO8738879.1 hypothetical protein [Salmonella enterica]